LLKIGEFSKLSHLTVKALRYYEKEGLLVPVSVDKWTGYRFYETSQLQTAAEIKSFRQLGLTIEEIKQIHTGADAKAILTAKAEALRTEKQQLEVRLSIIHHILEENSMKYQITEKIAPGGIVYFSETTLKAYSDIMQWIPALGAACLELNPGMKCTEPAYEFCEYLDEEYKETEIRVRHSEMVTELGQEDDNIHFKILPETRVISLYHKGSYDGLGEAYAYIMKFAKDNGLEVAGPARESYIDGIWNKESEEDWLTEIQLPVQ